MKFLKKRNFSLLELLIALALTISILMTLMFFYRQITEIGIETERSSSQHFEMRYVETRLGKILPRVISVTDKKNDFVFFSTQDDGVTKPGSQSLIFTFDNQVSLNKVFSNHLLARLYLDPDGNLMITYWPSPKRWENHEQSPMKKELLMTHVENLSFEFYIAPQRKSEAISQNENTSKGEKAEPEPKGDWRKQLWQQDYQQLPVMVKIIVTLSKSQTKKSQKTLVFIYPIPQSKHHIIYE